MIEVTVEKMAAGGDAIARLVDGRVVFVTGALPGERVRARVTNEKKDYAKAVAERVLEASPSRVAPPCEFLAAGCGGCGWQHIDPAAQLEFKADIVRDALRRTAKLPEARVFAGGSVSPWEYRTTLRLAVGPSGRVGLRAASSHRVVEMDHCLVAHPSLSVLLPFVRVRDAAEVTLRIGAATGEITASASPADGIVTGLDERVGVGHDAVLHEVVAGARLRVSAASFFQSGPAAAELLVREVRAACSDLLGGPGGFLDAYGGVGLFAATLGPPDAIIIESSTSACADATVNLPDARVECVAFEQWQPQQVRLAVVDPARAGLGAAAAAVLAATGAERIVLVSCDPVSLARDTFLLAGHGYTHDRSTVLDLFPHTPHVEVVTVFARDSGRRAVS